MRAECISDPLEFQGFEGRRVVAAFDGGLISADAGALLLRETDRAVDLIGRVAGCFHDGRSAKDVEHSLRSLVGQRIVGLALGYADVNDHDALRHDPVLALFSDKLESRRRDCAPLAGKSTMNRLEHSPRTPDDRYHKISHDPGALEALFVELFVEAHERAPKRIVLDLDATDDPLHGAQEGRFFHGYYGCYCYLPLYIFCGRHLLAARLRRSNIDGAAGAVEEVARIVARIRADWPEVEILLRGDSGFARDDLMSWCEAEQVDYLFGLQRNRRLVAEIETELEAARRACQQSTKPARRFRDLRYRTRKSWSRERRVVGKAEVLPRGDNPRFVVTSIEPGRIRARTLYEGLYCARGDMENRIKEQQLDLFADRTSARSMRANQLRLWFSSFAYVLIEALRRIALSCGRLAKANPGTIRLHLLKIGAKITRSIRRFKIAMASACPYRHDFILAHRRLTSAAA